MKIFGLNSITIFLCLMVLFNLCNTPAVETGPATLAGCILGCVGTACHTAADVCLPLGASLFFTGPAAIIASTGCFLATGGVCACCITVCLGAGATPTP